MFGTIYIFVFDALRKNASIILAKGCLSARPQEADREQLDRHL
jgi:hypothetical protein